MNKPIHLRLARNEQHPTKRLEISQDISCPFCTNIAFRISREIGRLHNQGDRVKMNDSSESISDYSDQELLEVAKPIIKELVSRKWIRVNDYSDYELRYSGPFFNLVTNNEPPN